MITKSTLQLQSEIRELHEQLNRAEQQSRRLGDARMRLFLKHKLLYLNAELGLPLREQVGHPNPAAEQMALAR